MEETSDLATEFHVRKIESQVAVVDGVDPEAGLGDPTGLAGLKEVPLRLLGTGHGDAPDPDPVPGWKSTVGEGRASWRKGKFFSLDCCRHARRRQ